MSELPPNRQRSEVGELPNDGKMSLIDADVAIPVSERLAVTILDAPSSDDRRTSSMPIIECTCSVPISVDDAEQTWNAFLAQPQQAGGRPGDGRTDETIGTVYFKEEGGGRTQLTMQLDPTGVADGDEATLTNRMDSYLRRFKDFVESR